LLRWYGFFATWDGLSDRLFNNYVVAIYQVAYGRFSALASETTKFIDIGCHKLFNPEYINPLT